MAEVKSFAEEWWGWKHRKCVWEDAFLDLLEEGFQDYEKLYSDFYDCSLSIAQASNNWRLSPQQQVYVRDAGFLSVYLIHEDGWQTHYNLMKEPPVRGWRRRYVSDPSVATTNVVAGPPNNGYYQFSYIPEQWSSEHTAAALASGYYRVVPDLLDPWENI